MQNSQAERNPHGAIIVDGVVVADSLSCPHCNAHFLSVKGSGVQRSWCPRCHAVCCGREECMVCIPFEAKLDFVEGTRSRYDDEIRDAVSKYGPGVLL